MNRVILKFTDDSLNKNPEAGAYLKKLNSSINKELENTNIDEQMRNTLLYGSSAGIRDE